ncbi:MAG: hypothetical protein COA78_20415 [Blastopirellula sp.]|nr:MAG: hypothetical protein COA78_20415 [Blastopirellula sp.]
MSGKTAVVYTCSHSDPKVSNVRAEWMGALIYDIRPDYVVDLGDSADMRSLNSYDTRRPEKIVAQNYGADIRTHLDFQEKIRWKFKKNRKKRPAFFGFEGNHEQRISKAVADDPRLNDDEYGISVSHLQTNHFFDEYHPYEYGAPAIHNYDGVDYAHYIGSGNFGRAISGEHHAYNLLKKRMTSVTVGHSHKRNIYFRDDAKAIGLVAGCTKGAPEDWAGQANKEWWSGVIIKRGVDNGLYEPEFVSMKRLEEVYGS